MYRSKDGKVEDSFQAFLVKGARFTSKENYPIIEPDMVSEDKPIDIMPFEKAIYCKSGLKNKYICFYERDKMFERVRRDPKKYLRFFKRCAGIIGFDYSVHTDMPLVKQKAQINDNLALTYYYGRNKVKVIPNIRYGIETTEDEFFKAIPKGSLISFGTYGFFKTRAQRVEWFCSIEKSIDVIKPKGIIVYGSLDDPDFDELKRKCPFYIYESWISKDIKRRKEQYHGKQLSLFD